MSAKHTPGPWRASETWRPRIGNQPPHDGDRTDALGNVFWGYSISGSSENGAAILPTLAAVHNFPDQVHANAHLIAAAPDLLEALKFAQTALAMLTDPGAIATSTPEDAWRIAVAAEAKTRAAILKAEGLQSPEKGDDRG